MRYIQGPSFDELVMDIEVQGFLKKSEEADYYLFRQERDQWVWVDRVRTFGGTVRVRALRRIAEIQTEVETSDEVRTSDRVIVQGKLGFSFRVLNAEQVVESSKGIPSLLDNHFIAILVEQVGKYNAQSLLENQKLIKTEFNRELRRRVTFYGIELRISRLQLRTQVDDLLGETVTLALAQMLEAARREFEMSWQSKGRRILADDDAYRILALGQADTQVQSAQRRAFADDQVYSFMQLLPTQREQLKLDADRVRQLGAAEADSLRYKLESVFGSISREQIPAALALLDPEAGRAMAEMMGAQVLANLEITRTELLGAYLKSKSGTALPPSLSPPPRSEILAFPTSLPSRKLDRVEQSIRESYPDVCDITTSEIGSSRKSYQVKFENLVVKFEVDDGKLRGVLYGTSEPSRRWLGTLSTGKPTEVLAVELISEIRNPHGA